MRRLLHGLYNGCGALSVVFLVGIAVLTATSIVSRQLGVLIPGLPDYAGYSMASASFLGLAYAFGHGAHVRVTLLLHFLKGRQRRLVEIWCLAIGTMLAAYLAWFAVKMVLVSHEIGDISQGPDATPLWIPQIGVALGAVVFAIAMAHRLVDVVMGAPLEEEAEDYASRILESRDG